MRVEKVWLSESHIGTGLSSISIRTSVMDKSVMTPVVSQRVIPKRDVRKNVEECDVSELNCVTVLSHFTDNELRYLAEEILNHLNIPR